MNKNFQDKKIAVIGLGGVGGYLGGMLTKAYPHVTFGARGRRMDSLIYIIAFANPDFSVSQQGEIARLVIGIQNASHPEWQLIEEVSSLLSGAGIDHGTAHDIQTEIWRKYILNCAYNVATAAYGNTIGQIRSDPEKTKNYEALVYEAWQVARAKKIGVTREHIDLILHQFHHIYGDDATSSLQRDIRDGHRTELETFSGCLVREAGKSGVPVPVSEKMYEKLRAQCSPEMN